ncbi:methionine--tRNA ligase [Chloroflexi bacterium TSY]|nr:methionine--tRNA ligase [Chloroflexi bacterium TSY]
MNNIHPNEQQSTFYITTSIPYVNAQPHIGHALEFLQADVFARVQRLQGKDVRFQTGTDENALKNVQSAEEAGIAVDKLVAQNSTHFEALGQVLNLSFDDFIRTSAEQRHIQGTHKFWQACDANGDIYKEAYRGYYCVGCEVFLSSDELVDGACPIHGTKPDLIEEENYFFRLSRYQDKLIELIESDQLRIVPETRKNEILSFIRQGLEDFSISRSSQRAKGWGIPVPGDPEQVIYVWFDALTNYITGPGYATGGELYQRYWLNTASDADQSSSYNIGRSSNTDIYSAQPINTKERVHVIGKDIIRFHAVYWPAMLLSAGIPLPTTIFVHGFLTIEGEKISKSKGNVIYPDELVREFGTDALRYYLLRKVPATGDSNFTRDEFVQSYNGDLADTLGNLVNRVVKMIERYYAGKIPIPGPESVSDRDKRFLDLAQQVSKEVLAELNQYALHKATAAIWRLIAAANKYIVDVAPWTLAKERHQNAASEAQLATTLYTLAEALRLVAVLLAPLLPQTATGIATQLGVPEIIAQPWLDTLEWGQIREGTEVRSGEVLFPKPVNCDKSA